MFSIYLLIYIDEMLIKIVDKSFLIAFSLNAPVWLDLAKLFTERNW